MSTNGILSPADKLQDRLNDPQTADALNRLLDRLDTIALAAESMDGFIRRGDTIADSVASSVSELKGLANDQAGELIQKAPGMLKTGARLAEAADAIDVDELERSRLLERLTDPQTLATLNQLLDRLPLATFLLQSLDEFLQRGDTIADNLSDAIGELRAGESNFDIDQLKSLLQSIPKLNEAAEKLLESELLGDRLPTLIDAGVSMVESGMMDKDLVATLGELGREAVETYKEVSSQPVKPVGGLFATLRATKDPDVQKSVGFFFAFAKAFAKHLK